MQHSSLNKTNTLAIVIAILSISAITIILPSCKKNRVCGCTVPLPTPRVFYLLDNKWRLSTATSIDSLSTGTLIKYTGTAADSIRFTGSSLNSIVDTIINYIGDKNINAVSRIGYNITVSVADTTVIAADTFMLSKPWKNGYSDTLFITKTSPTQLVFKVRYSLPTGSGVEIDTFHTVRTF